VFVVLEQPQQDLFEFRTEFDLVELGTEFLVLDEFVEVFILALVGVFEAGVPEHEQLHDDANGEHVRLHGVIRLLLVDFRGGLHAGP